METFCVMPWFGYEKLDTNISPCCLLSDDADVNKIKKDLLNGIKTTACEKCWKNEDSGLQSRRQQENIFLDYALNMDIERIRKLCINQQNEVLLYQIAVSNTCNQACVTCNSRASSKWSGIEKKMGITPVLPWQAPVGSLDINYKSALRLGLVGGEPLYDSAVLELLSNLLSAGNDRCLVSIVTNGSVHLNQTQIDLLSKFKNLNICVSIDGIGSVFEYLRWPASWSSLESNINQYRNLTKDISVSYTISSINCLYHEETVDWFKKQNLNFNYNFVKFPQWASVKHAPVAVKTRLLKDNFFNSFSEITGQELTSQDLLEKLSAQDAVKGTSLSRSLPKLHEILQSN